MTSTPIEPARSDASPIARSAARIGVGGFRLALIGVVIWGCGSAGLSILRLLRTAPTADASPGPLDDAPPPLSLGSIDGYWRFYQEPLQIPSSLTTAAGLDSRQLARLSEQSQQATEVHHAGLIDLPDGAVRICSRWTSDDRLALELFLFKPPLSAEQLVEAWRQAGWSTRATGWGESDDFSLLCSREDRVVSVWSAGGRDQVESLLVVNATLVAHE